MRADDEHAPWLFDQDGQRPRREDLAPVKGTREVSGFCFAEILDGLAPDGEPIVSAERGWITEPASRQRFLRYLRGAPTVVHSPMEFGPDYIDPARRLAVPKGYRTDGRWVWPMAVEYYLEQHGIAPEPEFSAQIARAGYRCPPVTVGTVREALDALRERTRAIEERMAAWRAVQAPGTEASAGASPRFPPDVHEMLTRFGWHPGRSVAQQIQTWFDELYFDELQQEPFWLPERTEAAAAARRILTEFGGLTFGIAGPGRDHGLMPFAFYPGTELPDVYCCGYLEGKIGCPLFPIGTVDTWLWDMAVDPAGRIYMAGDLDFYLGQNIDEALIALVRGYQARRVPPVSP